MKTSDRTEDYLKYIYILSRRGQVHGSDLADAMGITRPTVCVALKNMEHDGLILLDRDRAVTMTPKGMEIARRIYERNQAFEHMLLELGVDENIAREDACRLEHAVSPESFAALKTILK